MINDKRNGKEVAYDEEGNPQVDRAARSEHRNSNSHSPRSNILSGRLDKEGSQMTAFFICISILNFT